MKKRISLGLTINLLFMSILIPMIIIAGAGYIVSDNASEAGTELYTVFGKTQGDAAMSFAHFTSAKAYVRNVLYAYVNDQEKRDKAVEDLKNSQTQMQSFVHLVRTELSDPESLEVMEAAEKAANSYYDIAYQCVELIKQNKVEDARNLFLTEAVSSANETQAKMEEFLNVLDQKARTKQVSVKQSEMVGTIVIFVLVVVGVVIAIFAIIFMNKRIRTVIVEIAADAKRLGEGNISMQVPRNNGIKEIYELVESFHALCENLKRQAVALGEFANGNLNIDYKASSEQDVVGNAIVKLLHDNNRVMHTIRNATNQINLGSGQIASVSQTLAQGSTEQASAIEQITASITDIANQAKGNAEQGDEVLKFVMEVKENVHTGNVRVGEMVEAMRQISEAAENIHKVIKMIDDIAFNTNILALNATVEAARAGEQGKGFAVVAEEVRNLAGRSAEAAGQTAELIEDSMAKARRGSELAAETEESLNLIAERIDRIAELSGNIAKTSNDQANATSQIDQALTQVSQIVQTNSATSEECASASEELSGQAVGLNREIDKFRLRDIVGNMPRQALAYEEPPMLESSDNFMY